MAKKSKQASLEKYGFRRLGEKGDEWEIQEWKKRKLGKAAPPLKSILDMPFLKFVKTKPARKKALKELTVEEAVRLGEALKDYAKYREVVERIRKEFKGKMWRIDANLEKRTVDELYGLSHEAYVHSIQAMLDESHREAAQYLEIIERINAVIKKKRSSEDRARRGRAGKEQLTWENFVKEREAIKNIKEGMSKEKLPIDSHIEANPNITPDQLKIARRSSELKLEELNKPSKTQAILYEIAGHEEIIRRINEKLDKMRKGGR